jgi:hypothetical protein
MTSSFQFIQRLSNSVFRQLDVFPSSGVTEKYFHSIHSSPMQKLNLFHWTRLHFHNDRKVIETFAVFHLMTEQISFEGQGLKR